MLVVYKYFSKLSRIFYRWYDANVAIEFVRAPFKWNELFALKATQDELVAQQKPNEVDLSSIIQLKLNTTKDQQVAATADETFAQVLLKSLELMGYIEQNKKQNAEWSAFGKALKLAKINADQTLALLELCRYGVVSNKPLTPTYKRVVFSQGM